MPTLIDDGGANDNRCMVDGLLMNCEQVQVLLGSEVASQCNNNDCGPRMVRGHLSPLTTNPHTGELGYGHWERVGFKSRDPYTDEVLTSDGGQPRFVMDEPVETDRLSGGFMLAHISQKYRAVVESDINIADTSQSFENVRDEVVKDILDIANNQKCSDAFKKYGLRIPYDSILSTKFRIAPSATLFRPHAANTLGLTDAQVQTGKSDFSTSLPYTEAGAAGFTATNGNNLTIIFSPRQLNNPIFGGLKAVIIHEFIHAGGKPGRGQGGAPYGDLNYFKEGYEEIQKACQ